MSLSESRRKAIKDFALQIVNTTIAVIIALAFGALVDWRHERRQVADAQAQMQSELRDNRKDVEAMKAMIANAQTSLGEYLLYADRLMAAKRAGTATSAVATPRQALYSFSEVFGGASRATAEATGALAHMKYQELKRYSAAYEYQQHVTGTLERVADQFMAVSSALEEGLDQLAPEQLRAARGSMLSLRMLLTKLAGQRELLARFYDEALGAR
jgi:hypothetical protein